MDRYKQRRGILDDVPSFNPVPSYLGALADAVRGESVGGQLNAINAQQTQDAYRRHGLLQQEKQRQMAAQQQAAQAAELRRRFDLTHGLQKSNFQQQQEQLAERRRQQQEQLAERRRQFDLTHGLANKKFEFAQRPQEQPTYKDLNERVKAESSFRKEFTKDTQDFEKIQQFKNQITNAPNTGAGALTAVFGFMKLLDPNSVVRESEYANAENAGGVPARLRSIYNKALRGGMGEELMAEFRAEAERIYGDRLKRYNRRYERYEGIAKRSGMDVRNVLPLQSEKPEPGSVNNNDPAGIR